MDSIAHGLTGAVIGYCGFRQREGRAALWTSIVAAEFPDIDIVLLLVNGETYLRWHRSLTHSILLLPIWSFLVAFLIWEISGRKNIRLLWAASAAGMLSHLFMDWITSYGTMLLSPVSDARFSLNWVFIVDPYVWAMLGVALWAVIRTQSSKAGKVGITILCAYFLSCAASQQIALRAARNESTSGTFAAYPQPMNPLGWTIVRNEGDRVDWISGHQRQTFVQFRDEELRPKAEATQAVRLFLWFAESPLVEKLTENGRVVLRYRDLRFRSPLPWGGVREGMFVLAKVVFDEKGNVVASTLTSEE